MVPRRKRLSVHRRCGLFESLENRLALATYTWDNAADTFSLSLATNEWLTVYQGSGNVSFQLNSGAFTKAGGDTATGSGGNFITVANADLATSLTINNALATTGANNITFTSTNGAVTAGVIRVAITDPDANGTITFQNGFDLTASSELSLTSVQNIAVGSGSTLSGVGAGTVTLSANQQAARRDGGFYGIELNGGVVTSANGAILLQGRAGTTGSSSGVRFLNGGRITSDGAVRVEGTGGGGSSPADGVHLWGGSIDAAGAVTVIGTGGGADSFSNLNRGVYVWNGGSIVSRQSSVLIEGANGRQGVAIFDSVVQSLGTSSAASATVRGTGVNAAGVILSGTTSRITSANGAVLVDGTGGVSLEGVISSTADDPNATVSVKNLVKGGISVGSSAQVTSARGAVLVDGVGTVYVSGTVTSAGTNSDSIVTVKGIGTDDGDGLYIGGSITSSGGAVSVDGTGSPTSFSTNVRGVVVTTGGLITSAGATAPVTVKGLGGGTTATSNSSQFGIWITGGRIASGGGSLLVEGTAGGQGQPGFSQSFGVTLTTGVIAGGGTGAVTVRGSWSNSAAGGIRLEGSSPGSQITSGGALALEGTGIYLQSNASIIGAGDVTVRGLSKTVGTLGSVGVFTGAKIVSNNGAVLVEGTGGSGTFSGVSGVSISGLVETLSPTATVTVNGVGVTGGTNSDNKGVDITFGIVRSAGGAILVTGTGAAAGTSTSNNHGVYIGGGGQVRNLGTDASATITIRGTSGPTTSFGTSAGVTVDQQNTILDSAGGPVLVEGTGVSAGVAIKSGSVGGVGDVTVRGTATNYGVGLLVSGKISSTGGAVWAEGRGGAGGSQSAGVKVLNGIISTTGGSGSLNVKGYGGLTSSEAYGVTVDGSSAKISSFGGPLLVEGYGGTGNSYNGGVWTTQGGLIENQGTVATATVTVRGFGGSGTNSNFGVNLDGWVISSGGPILVEGTGGGSAPNGAYNDGVLIGATSNILTSNSATAPAVTMVGRAGPMFGFQNVGVNVRGQVFTRGPVSLTAEGNGYFAEDLVTYGQISGRGGVTLTADTMSLNNWISAEGGSVTVRPRTAGVPIDLGGSDQLSPKKLGLSDYELDLLLSVGMLLIGDATAGPVNIVAPFTRSASTAMTITSGGAINFANGVLNTGGGNLTLNPGAGVSPATAGVEVNTGSGTLAFTAGDQLALALNGVTVDSEYQQLKVAGGVDLTGVTLTLSGSLTPRAGQSFTLIDNDGVDAIGGNFTGLAEGAVLSNFLNSGLFATLSYVGGSGNDVTLTVGANTQYPANVTSSATGARIALSQPAVIGDLNLYSFLNPAGQSATGLADVQLVNAAGQSISGSLVVAPGDTDFIFVATAGGLPAGTYTLTLRSGADGFHTIAGVALDGDGDGNPGDDLVTTFTIAAPPANTITVSLPFFARGPGQEVNVPASSTLGIPLSLSSGAGLTWMSFELQFDPGLLNITGVNFAAGIPGDGVPTVTSLGSGRLQVAMTFSSPLPAGPQTIAYLVANVPNTAANRYGERGVLDLANLQLLAGAATIPGIDQDAAHVNAYFGDVSRDGVYNSFDVQQVSRAAVGLDTGYQQHLLLDPRIISDFDGSAAINSFDVQRTSRLAVGLPIDEAPPLPVPPVTVSSTGNLTADDPMDKPATTTPDPVPTRPAAPALPHHNAAPGLRSDVDNDGVIDAQDILWAVYFYNQSLSGSSASATVASDDLFADVNGDNQIDPADILFAVSDFNLRNAAEGESSPTTTTRSAALVAESFDPADDLDSLACLLATDWEAVRKTK